MVYKDLPSSWVIILAILQTLPKRHDFDRTLVDCHVRKQTGTHKLCRLLWCVNAYRTCLIHKATRPARRVWHAG
jgi:hypothetical protein